MEAFSEKLDEVRRYLANLIDEQLRDLPLMILLYRDGGARRPVGVGKMGIWHSASWCGISRSK
jgi:hypothetical protein